LLARYAIAAPGVDVLLETCPTLELIGRVRDRRLDAAVVCLPAPVNGLRVTPLGVERVTVALPESHPAAGAASIGPRQLDGTPLFVTARPTNPAFFDGLITAWREAGFAAGIVEVTEPNLEHLLLTVAAGAGAALLPESARERYAAPGVRFRPLASSPRCDVVLIAHPEPASIAASAFLQLARVGPRPAREAETVAAAS
jgi:DNA-binding transcriptional LysR family regulator